MVQDATMNQIDTLKHKAASVQMMGNGIPDNTSFVSLFSRSKKDTKVLIEDTDDEAFS